MRAVNYQGPFKVTVEDVPKPKLEHPDDIIVKVTTVRNIIDSSMNMSDRKIGSYLRIGPAVSTGVRDYDGAGEVTRTTACTKAGRQLNQESHLVGERPAL